jgi:hypothetical protein
MTINRDAFAEGLFNVAYHALMAALYCARLLPSEEPMREVERIAAEQLIWIDQNAPDYEHSTLSAAARKHDSIFLVLARQAEMSIKTREISQRRGTLEPFERG